MGESDMPSVEDPEDTFGWQLPEADEEWNELWECSTYPELVKTKAPRRDEAA